jgi:hypothetical protein
MLALALAGCGASELHSSLVASQVKTFEGDDVEVKSCREVGDAITQHEDYGATVHEAWKCAVKQLDGTSGFEDACYVVYDELASRGVRGIRCATVGWGCPPGGRGTRQGRMFLGFVIHPALVLETARGNAPPHKTVRVEVSYEQAGGTKERCGDLDVRVPIEDDPMALATEGVEGNGWAEHPYAVSYSIVDA